MATCLKLLNKQDQIRVLDHRNACEVLCILLMSAENYAMGNSPGRRFGKFDRYDNVKNKSPLGLKRQLIYEIVVCYNSFRNYVDQYNEFNFPKNLSQNDIKKYVYKWKSMVNFNDQKYYDDIISIIEGKEIPDRRIDLSQLPYETTEKKKMKVNNMIEYTNNANNYLDIEEAKATKEFENNGNFIFDVEFDARPGEEIKKMEEAKKKRLEMLRKEILKKEKDAKEARERYDKEKKEGCSWFQ
jgi:hypothetical protein